MGIKIIIAGHHASKYERFPKYFNRREVIYGKTGELIKHCEFAITRGSTAINFAIIYNKPIIFYTTKECEVHEDIKNGILSYSACFNKKPVNIDNIDTNLNWDDIRIYFGCRRYWWGNFFKSNIVFDKSRQT